MSATAKNPLSAHRLLKWPSRIGIVPWRERTRRLVGYKVRVGGDSVCDIAVLPLEGRRHAVGQEHMGGAIAGNRDDGSDRAVVPFDITAGVMMDHHAPVAPRRAGHMGARIPNAKAGIGHQVERGATRGRRAGTAESE